MVSPDVMARQVSMVKQDLLGHLDRQAAQEKRDLKDHQDRLHFWEK